MGLGGGKSLKKGRTITEKKGISGRRVGSPQNGEDVFSLKIYKKRKGLSNF